jgi:hypothetical protein
MPLIASYDVVKSPLDKEDIASILNIMVAKCERSATRTQKMQKNIYENRLRLPPIFYTILSTWLNIYADLKIGS